MIKIAINGFGRIGRNVLRAFYEQPHFKSYMSIVAINDLSPLNHAVHLLKHDSVHKKFDRSIFVGENYFKVNNDQIAYSSHRDINELPWKHLDIDIVLECTGKYTTKSSAEQHIAAGAKRVIVSSPCDNADKTIVYGVNEHTLNINDLVISNASCTTNCLAPLVSLLHTHFGVVNGIVTTIHSYTGDQRLVDTDHSDLYRARAANLSMIPSKTGAAKAIGLIIPELAGKISGLSIRIPTPNVSLVDLTANLNKEVTKEELNQVFKEATAQGLFSGVLGYNDEPLVSCDFNHDAHSAVFDSTQTFVQEKLVKVFAWYDNEWGFSNRMLDLSIAVSKLK